MISPTPFGTPIPFGIASDKDRSKNRSRQVTGIRYPSFDEELSLPFVNTTYIGHPACEEFTGEYLCQKISDQLQSFGINVTQFQEGFTGSSYDGQYLNLKVNNHLKAKYGMSDDNATTEIWDGAHVVDLIFRKSAVDSPAISTITSVVHKVTSILKNKVFEQYLSRCQAMGVNMVMPKTPKDIKFIKHGLTQMEDFMKMKIVIVETLRHVSNLNSTASSRKLAAECRAYLLQMLQPSFDLILGFVVDLVKLLAAFSLEFQKKHLYVNQYFNLLKMLQQVLSNINLSYDISVMPVDQRFVFRNFIRAVRAGPSQYSGPSHVLTRGNVRRSFEDCIRTAVDRCRRFVKLLVSKSIWFWFRHPYWKPETKSLLPTCAALLNHLMSGIHESSKTFITGGRELCIDCQEFFTERDQPNHNALCQSGVYLTVPSLLPGFQPHAVFALDELKKLLPHRFRHQVNDRSIEELRSQLQATKQAIVAMNIKPSMDSVSKHLFTRQELWDKCLPGVLLLYLKLLVIPCTEAFMETLGSIMENFHKRFSNQDPGLDDRRLQKEMFVKLNGPPLILCDPFICKVLEKYRSTGNRRFAHEAGTMARLPVSSLTIQRLKREAKADKNRIACLDFT